jgi:hypothetical protein
MGDAWSCLRTVCNDRLSINDVEPSDSATSFNCTEQCDVQMSCVCHL